MNSCAVYHPKPNSMKTYLVLSNIAKWCRQTWKFNETNKVFDHRPRLFTLACHCNTAINKAQYFHSTVSNSIWIILRASIIISVTSPLLKSSYAISFRQQQPKMKKIIIFLYLLNNKWNSSIQQDKVSKIRAF